MAGEMRGVHKSGNSIITYEAAASLNTAPKYPSCNQDLTVKFQTSAALRNRFLNQR
jgi:hypothetical protein